ncbi:hypothetical protein WJX72_006256 [[Myrmecia] bisecta]|uniref:RRM Nup35-type domain-containing protein n=1 Tax=[Myrmecia] bisecta TaxID=41462 RepID=A0AAW1QR19_9CHLO
MTPQSSREFASLLFTTRTQEDSSAPSYRSPRVPGRSPAAYGKGGLRESSTPRRRSLTPTGSLHRETPPPPPADSLFDSPAGAPAVCGRVAEAHPAGRASLGADATTFSAEDNSENWVTVFGFQPADRHLVLSEFSKCGEVVQFDSGAGALACNWLHLRFANKYQAQRALQRSGELLGKSLMIGVKRMDPRQQPIETPVVPRAVPQALPARPYRLDASSKLPQHSRSAWERVSEFVFGL